ncbi:hypothetical protein WA538_001019, partial [Blastocystis sp. DL]
MEFCIKPSTFTRKRITGHTGTIKCLDWSASGNLLASCGSDRTVRIWNSQRNYKCENTFSFSNHISQVKWSPVAEDVIACTFDKEYVKIWNIDDRETMISVQLTGYTDFLSWSPDGRFVAVENDKGTVYIINASTGTFMSVKVDKSASPVRNELCWGLDSTCLFVASKGDGIGRVDMIVYNEEKRVFQNEGFMDCHMGECTTIDIDRKHYNLVTGSTDTFVCVIDCNEMIVINSIKCQKTGIRCVRWTAEGKNVAICSEDGVIAIVGPTSGTVKCCFEISKDSYVFANHPKKTITAVASMGPKDTLVDIEIVHWKV